MLLLQQGDNNGDGTDVFFFLPGSFFCEKWPSWQEWNFSLSSGLTRNTLIVEVLLQHLLVFQVARSFSVCIGLYFMSVFRESFINIKIYRQEGSDNTRKGPWQAKDFLTRLWFFRLRWVVIWHKIMISDGSAELCELCQSRRFSISLTKGWLSIWWHSKETMFTVSDEFWIER